MYLSKVRIKNYRSIKEADLTFEKGKNIIVGKNNAGKSNIIKAIDLILGESSPTYHKLDNITENDFYKGDISKDILIFGVLFRESGEELNYNEINKCFGYRYHSKGYRDPEPIRHKIDASNDAAFWHDLESIMNIDQDDDTINITYVNPKLKNQSAFKDQLDDKYIFAYVFRAKFNENNKIEKDIRFLYKESKANDWILCFSAPIRNELLQSAVIPSFRDPKDQLRISNWSWYGKLLKKYIDPEHKEVNAAFDSLRDASNDLFANLANSINTSQVKVAFPGTHISFQFNPDTKIDYYKSALIYVNDGFNSLLQEKGSGIQSAVIIGLFHYYTRSFAHCSHSLLAIEEPEVYLHPQARRVISKKLDDFLEAGRNQVIITTHSTEFISSVHENVNIIVASKHNGSTTTKNTKFTDSKERQILTKSQNAEMFFADYVLLVEGGEKHILESLARYYGQTIEPKLGSNWLNDYNFSIISVTGKTEFWKYTNKLNELGISNTVLADFDFFLRQLPEFFTKTQNHISLSELNALKGRLNINTRELSEEIVKQMQELISTLKAQNLSLDEKELRSKIKEPYKIKRLEQINTQYHSQIKNYLLNLKEQNIFILEKELEDYFTDHCKLQTKRISGKEEKPIHIVSQLITSPADLLEYIDCNEYINVFELITKDIRASLDIPPEVTPSKTSTAALAEDLNEAVLNTDVIATTDQLTVDTTSANNISSEPNQ